MVELTDQFTLVEGPLSSATTVYCVSGTAQISTSASGLSDRGVVLRIGESYVFPEGASLYAKTYLPFLDARLSLEPASSGGSSTGQVYPRAMDGFVHGPTGATIWQDLDTSGGVTSPVYFYYDQNGVKTMTDQSQLAQTSEVIKYTSDVKYTISGFEDDGGGNPTPRAADIVVTIGDLYMKLAAEGVELKHPTAPPRIFPSSTDKITALRVNALPKNLQAIDNDTGLTVTSGGVGVTARINKIDNFINASGARGSDSETHAATSFEQVTIPPGAVVTFDIELSE